jgi:hypothetical protein
MLRFDPLTPMHTRSPQSDFRRLRTESIVLQYYYYIAWIESFITIPAPNITQRFDFFLLLYIDVLDKASTQTSDPPTPLPRWMRWLHRRNGGPIS